MANLFSLIKTSLSVKDYYKSMNEALKDLNDEYTMLHYPYFKSADDDFISSQKNLTDHCISRLSPIKGKKVLEIGCGNGTQVMYINEKYAPGEITGIDLQPNNIEIAKSEAKRKGCKNVVFHIDDAQELANIESASMDYVVNIESAFHYPDKKAFLKEVFRVLKPGGSFLIADLMLIPRKDGFFTKKVKGKHALHHWSKEKYEKELPNSELEVHSFENITENVIKGFKNYRNYFSKMKKRGALQSRMLKLYYSIHVKFYIHLLRKRRQYWLVVGQRPAA